MSRSRLKKISLSRHGTLNELNITPLLDLVFVLLVIFIITTPQLVNNLEMSLPSGQPPSPAPDRPLPPVQQIAVAADGQTFLNDAPVTVAALKERLQQLQAADPELAVVVKGADDVDYQGMIRVLDVLQQLAITKIGLATETTP